MSPAKQHVAGTAPAKKSGTVAQTCNQLSLFLKEKGCFRDLHLKINAKSDDSARMTVDLLSNMQNSDQNNAQTEKLKHMKPDESVKEANSNKSAPAPAPATMTIFYDGQVIVFDNIPADRARDVMLAAGVNCSSSTGKTENRVESASDPANVSESNQPIQVPVEANGLDLPIARRASLHKFLAKRKDRATVRAPYQLRNPSPDAGPSKNEHNFDLNL